MNLLEHLDKNNLHHAYLLEGAKDEIEREILEFTKGEDVVQISLNSFKIEDARNLKSYASEKSNSNAKKIYIISVNHISLEAEQALLKLFEEPIPNTHFFLIVPDIDALLKTFISRFYLISARQDLAEGEKEAGKFIKMPLQARIDFLKELLAEPDEEDIFLDSNRAKALKFLNSLELSLHNKTMSRTPLDTQVFRHIFKVREYLRMPGSSVKSSMESVALVVPNVV